MTKLSNLKRRIKNHLEEYLGQFVYGGIDGSVTTFAVVAGATGAQLSSVIVIILGFANLIADGFSMAVGSYLSSKSEIELARKNNKKIEDERLPIVDGLMTFLSFQVVGLVPLLAYTVDYIFKLNIENLFLIASVLTALSFIAIGLLKSYVTHTGKIRGVSETLILGIIAAVIAYFVGDVLERIVTQ